VRLLGGVWDGRMDILSVLVEWCWDSGMGKFLGCSLSSDWGGRTDRSSVDSLTGVGTMEWTNPRVLVACPG